MKKIIALILAAVLAVIGLAPAFAEENLAGGWTVYANAEEPVPAEAAEALAKALEQLVGAAYEPAALLATQVVAGVNYAILCTVTPVVPNAVPNWAIVYVYAGVDGTCEILEVQDIAFGLTPIAE